MTVMDEKPVIDGPLLAPEFLRRLESLELVSKKMLAGRMKGDRLSKRKGRGVAIVLSDFMDKNGYEDGLRYLTARNLDVYAIQILSDEEIDPTVAGDLKLTDIEDGDEAEVTISAPLLQRYRDTLAAFKGSLNAFCTRRGMNCLFTSNRVPFEKLVLGYLRSRGLVR